MNATYKLVDGVKVIDVESLYAQWEKLDRENQQARWQEWYDNFNSSLGIRQEWYPIFETCLKKFWQNSAIVGKVPRATVEDLVFAGASSSQNIPYEQFAEIRKLLSEFIQANTSATHEPDKLMWRDSTRGKGAGLYLNPAFAKKPTPTAPPSAPSVVQPEVFQAPSATEPEPIFDEELAKQVEDAAAVLAEMNL